MPTSSVEIHQSLLDAMVARCKATGEPLRHFKTVPGTPLTEATAHQAEFKMTDVPGTIVGLWSPPYARSINVAGWHLHFLTDDRRGGGHLLGCGGAGLEAKMEDLDDLRLAISQTTQFLHADLTQDPSRALDKAGHAH